EESGFRVGELLFEGRIYDADKIGTRIHAGTIEGNEGVEEAVLKVQLLPPSQEEAELMMRFTAQNKSQRIRTPIIYKHAPYSDEKGYGYTIMERVHGQPIFEGMAREEAMDNFVNFHSELHALSLNEPLFNPNSYESDARLATSLRLANWNNIARKKDTLTHEKVILSGRHSVRMLLEGVNEMEFMHGHLTSRDILVTEKSDHVLMSHSFWGYRPRYYDTTFQIWAAIKESRGDEIPTPEQAIAHAETWRRKFKESPHIANDPEFSKYFASNMRERALGALIVDIENDCEGQDLEKLKKAFRALYDFYMRKSLP
ncbi:MAG: phosphotransferase, partial [Candidatus Peregrinibacteria bacterium]|nr:phosphotransferase [Candidatus Peregrinibacteria bacterium]